MNLLDKNFWVTPTTLKALLGGIVVLTAALCLSVVNSNRYIHEAVKLVGKDAAPSIINAQKIKSSLSQMDAEVSNYLIGKPGQNIDALRGYEKRRRECIDFLTRAAEEISFGEEERVPILKLLEGFSDYQEEMANAITLHERGDPAFLAYFRHGTQLLHQSLMAEADKLDAANRKELDQIYSERSSSINFRTFTIVLLTATIVMLLYLTQRYLTRKTNTVINPYLAAATVIIGLFGLHTGWKFYSAGHDLRTAKDEAFESIHIMVTMRATTYDMLGDESRALLDKPRAGEHRKNWTKGADAVAKRDSVKSWDQVVSSTVGGNPAFSGKLADALKSVSFEGERDALLDALRGFAQYSDVAGKVRQLADQGKRDAAIKLAIGYEKGESNYEFRQFDEAVDRAIAINQAAFKASVEHADHDLDGVYVRTPLVGIVVALLAIVGIYIRLRVYSLV
jgi:hypothetical protein